MNNKIYKCPKCDKEIGTCITTKNNIKYIVNFCRYCDWEEWIEFMEIGHADL